MAKKVQKGSRGFTIRGFFKLLKWGLFISLIVLFVGGFYLYRTSKQIEYQFSRSHKWDIPSKIYSDAAYYYPGINVAEKGLREKLERLGYRDTGTKINGPGDYSISPTQIEIYLHDFNYPLQKFKGSPVKIDISGHVITGITNMEDGTALSSLKLEPELISAIFGKDMEDRTLVSLSETPQHLLESIIIIEDERFFKHGGVDPIAIGRAALKDIVAMSFVQGGSTLTQQLVKNYFLNDRRTLLRKVQEAAMALILERKHTKAEILEAYINEIYFGQRGSSSVSGVGEAAKLYFAKNVGQLTIGECALLAGMIRAPGRYDPFTQTANAKERRDFVLSRLYGSKLITKEEYKTALAEPIITPKKQSKINLAPYFIDFVKMQLQDLYSEDILTTEGLDIFTTLDMTHQLIAETAVKDELKTLQKDFANTLPKDHEGELEGALVSIQPQTGYIRALVGGSSYLKTQFNHITQALRQPGSTFKPFVYLTAFDPERTQNLYSPASIIDDTSFSVEAGGENWSPQNYDNEEHGSVSLRTALKNSYNIATAKLALSAGLEAVLKTARDCGITSDLLAVPSMALGAFEVTPLEMAAAYTIFPNNGIRAEPVSIINVVTKDGEVLERKNIEMKRVFDPKPVYLTNSILKDVMNSGTGAGARGYGFTGVAGGKTGTTSNYKDAWFVGFTTDYLALVWVGYDDNAPTNLSGGRAALPIWAKFMKEAIGNPIADFASPSGVILVKVDPKTGLLSDQTCPESTFEPFIEGTEPDRSCKSATQ